MYLFEYVRPASVTEAVIALRTLDDPKLLAGGMTLIPTLKQRLAMPSDLVDLGAIEELRGVSERDGTIIIGAMTPHADVARSELIRSRIPGLAVLAGSIGDPLVRNRGTIGGSIANNDPAADYPAGMVALGAVIVTDRREIAAEQFFTGMFETALEEDEIVVAIRVVPPARSAYAKFANPVSRYAMAGVFIADGQDGPRVAVTGASHCVFRARTLEEALRAHFAPDGVKNIAISEDEMNSDMHGSAAYRAHLVSVVAARAVQACLKS